MDTVLTPSSRPDRSNFWVRFKHPVTDVTVRAGLGKDKAIAEDVCNSLTAILREPSCWEDRNHEALDGLNETAVTIFYGHLDRCIQTLQFQLLERQLETAMKMIDCVGLQAELGWLGSSVRDNLLGKGIIKSDTGMYFSEPKSRRKARRKQVNP